MFRKDTIYLDSEDTQIVDFAFDARVANVFPDMAHRSITGYATLITILQAVFRDHFKDASAPVVYDLGCSIGGAIMALSRVMPTETRFIGVDLSKEMLEKASYACNIESDHNHIKLLQADVLTLPLTPCDAVCMNFTVQFLPQDKRDLMLKKVYEALKPNGLLFMAEKVKTTSEIDAWHKQFKRNNGYSDLEIAKKRSAVENIMRLDTIESIEERLQVTGFRFQRVFQGLCFYGWVAEKC